MLPVTSFTASDLAPGEVNGLLSDYMALERARIFRQLLVVRCGTIATVIAVGGHFLQALPMYAHWGSVALFLVPPIWMWTTEKRLEARIGERLRLRR